MKLLTLNTHSLIEDQYTMKLHSFVGEVLRIKPDLITLQEVNQTIAMPEAPAEALEGYVPCPGVDRPVRADNHALSVAKLLRRGGYPCFWTWLPAKVGYDIYDEGLAIFSREPITAVDNMLISEVDDYHNWKTRRVLGAKVGEEWFYSVHMGWWKDGEEPFEAQWLRLNQRLRYRGSVWLLGDFNSDADVRGEGYDLIQNCDWLDTYRLARHRDAGYTVVESIDGWEDAEPKKRRIDQIWCIRHREIRESMVVFDGHHGPRVSDHAGILVVT